MSHLEVFWVGMKGRSLILHTEKLGPREELIFPGHIAIWGHNWRLENRVVSLQTSFALTQKLTSTPPPCLGPTQCCLAMTVLQERLWNKQKTWVQANLKFRVIQTWGK